VTAALARVELLGPRDRVPGELIEKAHVEGGAPHRPPAAEV
jgi:hypothetical protein